MDFYRVERELELITRMIWQPHLPVEIVRVYEIPEDKVQIPTVVGCVHIIGGWCGSVSLECCPSIAALISRRILYLNEEDGLAEDDFRGVIKELANVTGGNIKGLLGAHCILSTPRVVQGANFEFSIPETPEVLRLNFCCEDQYFVVRLHEGDIELDGL